MTPIKHIRTQVFKLSQAAFAGIAGVSQPTVSRWEEGSLEPSRAELDLIRSEAVKRGMVWNDTLFFVTPPQAEAAGTAA